MKSNLNSSGSGGDGGRFEESKTNSTSAHDAASIITSTNGGKY
jgi:hypothetical protein